MIPCTLAVFSCRKLCFQDFFLFVVFISANSALLLNCVISAQNTFAFIVENVAKAEAKTSTTCTTLWFLLMIVLVLSSAFNAIWMSEQLKRCSGKFVRRLLEVASQCKSTGSLMGASQDDGSSRPQPTGAILDITMLTKLPSFVFRRGRGTGLTLKRTGWIREPGWSYGKWSDSHSDCCVGVRRSSVVGLALNGTVKELLKVKMSRWEECMVAPPSGEDRKHCLRRGCGWVYPKHREVVELMLLGECLSSDYLILHDVVFVRQLERRIPSVEGGCGKTCLKTTVCVALRASHESHVVGSICVHLYNSVTCHVRQCAQVIMSY